MLYGINAYDYNFDREPEKCRIDDGEQYDEFYNFDGDDDEGEETEEEDETEDEDKDIEGW